MSLEHTQPMDAVPSPAAVAANVGASMARVTFAKRGNKYEAHMTEEQLAACCIAAAQVAIERYVELTLGTLGERKPPKRAG